MSLEEVLAQMKSMSSKVDVLKSDMDAIKKRGESKDKDESNDESRSHSSSRYRSRSRSRRRSRSYGRPRSRSRSRSPCYSDRRSRGEERPKDWADRDMERDLPDYEDDPRFSDDEDGDGGGQLIDVSEGTHRLLTKSCTLCVSHDLRKRTRSRYKLPRVEATRTPRVDHVLRSLAPTPAKSVDKELARIQTFVLDSLAPVTSMLENAEQLSVEDVKEASSAAVSLIGNANAKISRLRREKLVSSINKNLVPLVKEDTDFQDVAPNLFGPDFSKRAKEHLDQVKALRQATNSSRYSDHQAHRKPLFRRGFPSGRGQARGRGGASSHFKGNRGERNSRQQTSQ